MKATLKDNKIYLSKELVKEARVKAGNRLFFFSLKGENRFGFHKADPEMAKSDMLTYPIRRSVSGKLYVTPTAPPVGLIKATMRLSYKDQKTVSVSKQNLKELDIFIINKK